MKDPAEWKEEDLFSLINAGAEEGPQQEFKSAAALNATDRGKTDIGKDVSSFANSAGGVIIYGMDEDPTEPHKAIAISTIDPKQFSKEWLEQVINSRIQPRIQGLGIFSIDVISIQPQGACYVVTIPQSFTTHQASDHRYYK
jgi:predicted HTH transcriptional regulator